MGGAPAGGDRPPGGRRRPAPAGRPPHRTVAGRSRVRAVARPAPLSWCGRTTTTPGAVTRCGGGGARRWRPGPSLADTADVTLPDGAPAWIDGGPRSSRPLTDQAVVHAETVEAGRLDPVPAPVPPTAALDSEQLAAVDHDSGPARVIAPAGSGKTRVLTERLRHLIADRGYETGGVLAVAYNKQAQLEMASRTTGLGARIQTLNAWGYGLVARIQGTRPEVIEERAMRAIVEGLVPRPARRVNTDPYARYLEGFRSSDSGSASPEQVEAEFGDVPGLAAAFVPYRAAAARPRARRLRRTGLPRPGIPPRRRDAAPFAPGRAPPSAGRRVPGPDPGPSAARPAPRPAPPTTSSGWATTTRPSTAMPEPTPASSSTTTATSRRPPTTPSRSTTAARRRSPRPPAICSATTPSGSTR